MDVVRCAMHLHSAMTDVACAAVRVIHQYGCTDDTTSTNAQRILSSMI